MKQKYVYIQYSEYCLLELDWTEKYYIGGSRDNINIISYR